MHLVSKVGVTALLLCASLSVFAGSWGYKVNPNKDVETICITPNGDTAGGWRDCRIDLTCNQAEQIRHRCEMRLGGAALGWHYAVNPDNDHETKCIKPNGDFIGGFRSCDNDKTCNNYEAIRDVCRVTYEK